MSIARVLIAAFLLLIPNLAAAAPVTWFGFNSDRNYGDLTLDERQGGVATWMNGYGAYEPPSCYEGYCQPAYYPQRLWASGDRAFGIVNGEASFPQGRSSAKRTSRPGPACPAVGSPPGSPLVAS